MQITAERPIPKYQLETSTLQLSLTDGEVLNSHNAEVKQPAASLAKLWIGCGAIYLAQEGTINLNQATQITWQEFFRGDYGTGRLRHFEIFIDAWVSRLTDHQLIKSITLEKLVRYCILHSDNLAAQKLADVVGRDRLQERIFAWGMNDTTILNNEVGTPNETTASDVGLFLLKLHNNDLISSLWVNQIEQLWLRQAAIGKTSLAYKEGRIHDRKTGLSYYHRAGYAFRRRNEDIFSDDHWNYPLDEAFVILTSDNAQSNYGRTSTQQEHKVREITQEIALRPYVNRVKRSNFWE